MSKVIKHPTEYRPLAELKKLPDNPRTITKEAMERLKKSLKNNTDYFEARPLILSNRTGELIILAGNQRYEAAKALGLEEVPCCLIEGLTKEQEQELIIRDNVELGDWDYDALANGDWVADDLLDWGVDIPDINPDDVIDQASLGTVREFNDDTKYDLTKLIRETASSDLLNRLRGGVESGSIRPEIADILERRAQQCTIFNFDEIIKFYRSGDATADEKDLLRRFYLVFITPRETIENAMLEVDRLTAEIYDNQLMEKFGDETN